MIKLALTGPMALALCGCAQLQSAVDFIDSPTTQQAVATVTRVSTAFVCDLSSASAVAQKIEAGVGAKAAVVGTTDMLYTASSAVCGALKGSVVGTASNVPAVTSVTAQ